jgi:hypothetical protein
VIELGIIALHDFMGATAFSIMSFSLKGLVVTLGIIGLCLPSVAFNFVYAAWPFDVIAFSTLSFV